MNDERTDDALVDDAPATVRDRVRDLIDDAPDAARAAVGTGRDLYRRGTAAIVRTGGDNTALTMLAAGTAVAAVSWLLLRRRRKPKAGRRDA